MNIFEMPFGMTLAELDRHNQKEADHLEQVRQAMTSHFVHRWMDLGGGYWWLVYQAERLYPEPRAPILVYQDRDEGRAQLWCDRANVQAALTARAQEGAQDHG